MRLGLSPWECLSPHGCMSLLWVALLLPPPSSYSPHRFPAAWGRGWHKHLQLDQGPQGREGLRMDGADSITAQVPATERRQWDSDLDSSRSLSLLPLWGALLHTPCACPQQQ